jgi:serine/threonine-protein kinase
LNIRLPQLAVVMVGTAFLGYWALLVYCDVWRPSPHGMRSSADFSRVVVEAVEPGSPAYLAGLRPGDRIVSSDGYSIRGRLDWMTVDTNLEIGRDIPLSVEREGVMVNAVIPVRAALWESWREQHGPELLVMRTMQLVTLLVAWLVALTRPRDGTALVGAAFLASMSVFSVTLPYRFASSWRALPSIVGALLWVPFLSSVAVAAWAFSFFAVFPRVRFRTWATWCGVWLPIVPGLVGHGLYGYYTIGLGRPMPTGLPWAQGLLAVSAAYVIAALVVLVATSRSLTDINEQRRVRVVTIGLLAGVTGGAPVILSYWYTSADNLGQSFLASPFATAGMFLCLALPLSFAYAILRHRLFDTGMMIRQGLRYVLARRALLALVPAMLVVLGVDLLAHGGEPAGQVLRRRVWLYAALACVSVAARLQRRRWLDALDRRFFRERYNVQRLLRQVAEDVRQAAGLDAAAPVVVSRIEQALHPSFVALLVRDHGGRCYRTVAASPPGNGPPELNADNKLLRLVGLLGKPLQIADSQTAWLARKMPIEDVGSVRGAAIDFLVPIAPAGGSVPAFFALGPKRSEEPYTEDDGELLMAIAESLVLRLPAIGAPVDGIEECQACGACYDPGTGRCRADGGALVSVSAPRLLAGRYRLERRLGGGGMGTVYVALDTSLDRRVAAKLVREDLVGLPGAAERFQREARAAATFSHPNVVTVHDFGVSGTHAFLVMELIDGRSLRETLREEGRIERQRAIAVLRDVTAAVEAAHRQQIVHRDLKPENICLVSHGATESAKVLDFGLAKFLAPTGAESLVSHATGALAGTPLYMAPGQINGEEPDPSWDLWALAVIAFEMLCGAHPFASLPGGLTGAADPRFAHLPGGVQPFFARALSLDRAARPESAALFLAQLQECLHA